MNLFDLVAVLTLNKKAYDEGLKGAEKSASSFSTKLKSGVKTAGKVATASLALVGAGAVGLTKKLMDTSSATADLGDHIDKQSQKIGISAKAYQEWDFILTHNGASVDSLQASMKNLSNQAAENADEFAELGISEEYLQSASPEELFERVVKELQGMEQGTKRTALASKLLGKAGTELAPVLNSTSEEIEAMRQQAHDLGKVMSDEAVKAGAAYEDSLYNLQTAVGGLKNKLGSSLLPSIVKVMDGLTGIFTGDDSAIGKLSEGISNLADKILESIPKIANTALKLVYTLGEAIVKNLPTILDGIIKALPEIVKGIFPLIAGIAQAFVDNIDTFLDAAIEVLNMIIDYVIKNIGKVVDGLVNIAMKIVERIPDIIIPLVEALPDVIESIITALTNNLPMIISGLIDVIVRISEKLPDIIISIIEKLPTLIQQILDALLNSLPQIIEGLIKVVVGIVEKLPEIIMSLIKAVPQIIKMVIEALIKAIPQLVQGCIQLVVELVTHLPEIFMALIEAIPEILKSILEAFGPLGEMLGGLFEGIVNVVGGIFEGLKSIAGGIVDAITGVFKGAYNVISGIVGTIKGWVDSIVGWLSDIIGKTQKAKGVVAEGDAAIAGGIAGGVGNLYTKKPHMASGGILERGQVGILEGSGAEAVVPLENNRKWISAVARDMQSALASQNVIHSGTLTVKGVDKNGDNVDIYDYIISQTTGTMRRQVRMA